MSVAPPSTGRLRCGSEVLDAGRVGLAGEAAGSRGPAGAGTRCGEGAGRRLQELGQPELGVWAPAEVG
jgi:hypothetical protein